MNRIIFNKHSVKSKGKRKLKFSLSIIFFCFLSFTAAAILIGATGYGIAPPSIYDKHIKEDTSQLSQQERFKKDFDFLYKEIKNNYVNLGYKEKTFNFSWDQLYEKYRSSIENAKNEKEFYIICSEFMSYLRDGHSGFYFNNQEIGRKVLEGMNDGLLGTLEVRMIENKPIIIKALKGLNATGNEIVSINGIDFPTILDTMSKFHCKSVNDIITDTALLTRDYFFRYFLYSQEKYPEKLDIKLRDSAGTERQISINTRQQYSLNSMDEFQGVNFGAYGRDQLPTYKILDGNIGYILIPSFNNRVDKIVGAFDSAVKEMKANNVEGVIIDVRYNSGGNQSFRDILGYLTSKKININNYRLKESEREKDIFPLRRYYEDIRSKWSPYKSDPGYTKWWMWPVKPAHEQFLTTLPVAVLSNEAVFSSADDFVNTCMNFKLAHVVGNIVPSSGHGLPVPVVLPSKNYQVVYGFIEDRGPNLEYKENVVREPDTKAEQKLGDLYIGIDTQINAAVEYIKTIKK